MKRTNIYLAEAQTAALDQLSAAQGVSRAELIRRLVDVYLHEGAGDDLEADVAAIDGSFGVLDQDEIHLARGDDERARHLARIAGP